MVLREDWKNGIISATWGLMMGIICSSALPVRNGETEKLFIFITYFILFFICGCLFFAKAKKIGHYEIIYGGMAATVISPILGFYLVERFGMLGYLATILIVWLGAKLYLLYQD